MKVSLNWVRALNDRYGCSADPAPDGVDKLVERIGAQLGAVEEVIDVGRKYEGILAVEVVSCQKHPNADKLSVCLINDGGVNKRVERNRDGLVEIVCGAPNARAGILAAWIPPGNTVPVTFDKEPLVLDAREIRGVVSNGMLASLSELGIGDDHSGILEIDKTAKPGDSFASLYKMDDFVIDIENKMFTHRPDLFGMLGIARELAGIQGHSFKSPEWYRQDANVKNDGRSNGLKLRVENELPKLVPRFCAVAMKDVKLEPSPVWLRASLSRIGIKPINNLVDLSNFYMYLTAQPIHIYDYDKIKKLSGNSEARLLVRRAKQAEKTTVLGGKEISLSKEDMVVTVGKQIVCVGGIIGAVNSEVDDNTKNIIVEAASWDMNTIRKTAMSQGLFTDAATRFTRGQSPLQNMAVIGQIVSEIRAIAGGRVASQIVDENNVPPDAIKRGNLYPAVKVSVAFINSRLGLTLSRSQISKLLQTVEFKVESKADELTVTAPFWRIDVEIPEDIVEEVGRLYGYGHLPLDLPKRDLTPPKLDPLIAFKSSLRDILSSGGANEVLTYSFVNESLLKKANQDPKDAYHIRNAISPDLQYYRLSLTPSLLERIHPNIKLGFDKFVIFEIGKVHSKTEVEEGLPREFDRLALVLAKDVKETYNGSPFFSAKKYISYLFSEHDIQASYTPLDKVDSEAHKLTKHTVAVFEPLHSSGIYADGEFVGVLGEYKAEVSEALKLPAHSAGFELFISALQNPRVPNYEQLNRYPSLDQDICLRTDIKLSYATLESFINERLQAASHDDGYGYRLDPIDIFQKKNDENYKQTTWRITLWHPQKTLTTQEANNLLDKIAEDAAKKFKAERV